MKIAVLERNSVGTDVDVSCFEELGEVKYYPITRYDEITAQVGDADVIILNKAKINEDTIGSCKNVKLVCEFATGFDNVDIEYCRSRGIKVCNVTNYSTNAVAQHTFAMALYLVEHMRDYDEYVKSGEYTASGAFSYFDKPFAELDGKTWGIIGLGNIGKKTARIAESFGCKVIYYSVTGKNSCEDYERVDFDTLLRESDFISVHCPLSDLTKDLIDLDAMKKMKNSAVLLNVARGPVVSNSHLYRALMDGEIAAAGLDVLEIEPLKEENPLSKIKDSNRLVITPHMAWASTEARIRLIAEVAENIKSFIKGENRNVVNL